MSGSMLSLDNNPCIHGLNKNVQVSIENSSKVYKNLSNIERQNLEKPMYTAFEWFTRGLRIPANEMPFYKSFQSSQSIGSPGAYFNRLSQPLNQSLKKGKVISSTTPKIVGAEIKKNIKYQPSYMNRHSISFGEDFVTQPPENNNIHHSNIKGSSVALEECRSNVIGVENQAYSSQQNSINQSIHSPVPPATPTLPKSMPTPMEDVQQSITPSGNCIKERISFFNKLASEGGSTSSTPPRVTFLSLLRQNEPKVIRLSQLTASLSAKNITRTTSKETIFGMKSSDLGTSKSCLHVYKNGSNSLPMPLRRKPSFEKTKVATTSIAKNINSTGTNPKRHNLMEDLSLVVPVKLRIAEYEKRISASK